MCSSASLLLRETFKVTWRAGKGENTVSVLIRADPRDRHWRDSPGVVPGVRVGFIFPCPLGGFSMPGCAPAWVFHGSYDFLCTHFSHFSDLFPTPLPFSKVSFPRSHLYSDPCLRVGFSKTEKLSNCIGKDSSKRRPLS